MWDTSCRDWERRLLAGESLVPELPLFEDEVARAIRVFNRLRLPDVIGKPTMAEAAGPWFRAIVAALFGSYDVETHRRLIQEVFLLVPKKNAKSTNSAALMVTAMIVNRRPNAEFQLVAPTKEIAGIAYGQAAGSIGADPALAKRFHLRDHVKTIVDRVSGAELTIKAADTDVITGSLASTLIDETHVFAKKSNAADIFVEIRGALAARPDGFLIQITTQSKDPPAGVFKSELQLARDVRDGLVKLPRLAVLYELPERLVAKDGWKRRELWPLVNPNLGRSVDGAFLENALVAAEASANKADALALLASQHFNVEIGLRMRADRWRGADYWGDPPAERVFDLAELMKRSEVATVGIDGGGLDDLLGLAVIGRERETSRWLIWAKGWAHDDVLEARKEIADRLRDFIADGDLVLCERPTQDVEEVAAICSALNDAGLLPKEAAIGLDAAGVAAIVDELDANHIAGEQLVSVQQGYRLNGAILGLERKLKDGTAVHCGSRFLAWCVSNAKAELRGNAVLITKEAAGKAKIDPLMAIFDAFQLMSRNPEATVMQLPADAVMVL